MDRAAKATRWDTKPEGISGRLILWGETFLEENKLLPWTLLFRTAIVVAVAVRWRFFPATVAPPLSVTAVWAAVGGFALYVAVLGLFAWRSPAAFKSLAGKRIQVALDTVFFTLIFSLGGDPASDVALAFLLPLLIAARYFTLAAVLAVFGIVLVILAGALLGLAPFSPALAQIFFIRALLFGGVTWPLARSEYLKRQMTVQTHEYRRRLELLVAQSIKFAQHQDIPAIVEAAARAARGQLRSEVASIFLYQEGRYQRQTIVGIEDDWFSSESYLPGEGITGQVGVGRDGTGFGRPILDNRAGTNPQIVRDHLSRYKAKLKSGTVAHLIAVPLNESSRTFGILRAVNKLTADGELDPKGFTQDDQDMLSSIAALVSLTYSAAIRERKLQGVFEVNETMTRTCDEGQVCQKTAEVIVGQGYRACALFLREEDDYLRLRAQCNLSPAAKLRLQDQDGLNQERLEVLHTGRPNTTANLQEGRRPDVAAWAREHDLCSVLRLPLVQQEQVAGLLEIYTRTEHHFYENEIHTLELFAAQATMAIMNARLTEKTQDQINKLKELAEITSDVVTFEDKDALFEEVAHRAAALLKTEDCSIFWVNRERNTIDIKASHSIPRFLFGRKLTPISDQPKAGFPAYVAATGETLSFIGDSYKEHPAWDGRFLTHLAHLPSKRCASLLIYPITDEHRNVKGVIKAENKLGVGRNEGFTQADRELLDVLASQVAIAVHKIEQIKKLKHLHQVARTITEAGELRDVLSRIVESACKVVPADLAVICPYDHEQEELLVDEAAMFGQKSEARLLAKPRASGLTQEVLTACEGYVLVENLDREPEKMSEFAEVEGVRSFMAVALKMENIPLGILYCNFRQSRRFLREEIHIAQAFGKMAAIAIHNAKLFTRLTQTIQELSAVQHLTRAALTKVELDLDSVLDVVLNNICDILGFEFCTVSLVNEAERTIETRRGRGVADEWVAEAKHDLDGEDIQAHIVRTGHTELISGWDDRLDPSLYARFGHENLVRVFLPLRCRTRIIGTVEAGYHRSHKPAIPQQEVKVLERYLRQVALVIETALLLEQERRHGAQLRKMHEVSQRMSQAISQEDISNVLQLAADMAVIVTRPGASATIHFYGRGHNGLLVQSSRGANRALLQDHSDFSPEDHRQVVASAERLIREGAYSPKDGVPSICLPLRTGGEVLGTLCVVYDRTHWFTPHELQNLELCAAQATTIISNARMHQQLTSSLDGLSDEIGRSYHWVGEPLAYVSHVLENLLAEKLGRITARQADRLGKALEELNIFERRIERLLLMRRLEEGLLPLSKVEVDVGALLEEAVAKVRPLAVKKRIEINCQAGNIAGALNLDREMMLDVLANILGNAVKFTPEKGRIGVRAFEQSGEVHLSIRDTGIGIAPQYQANVFEKYFQIRRSLDETWSGVGLGLYFARRFVEMHGGKITVDSRPDQGSLFTVILPK